MRQGNKELQEEAHRTHAEMFRIEGEYLGVEKNAKEANLRRGPDIPRGNFGRKQTLKELGISLKESSAAQMVAKVAKEQPLRFESFAAEKLPLKALVNAKRE